MNRILENIRLSKSECNVVFLNNSYYHQYYLDNRVNKVVLDLYASHYFGSCISTTSEKYPNGIFLDKFINYIEPNRNKSFSNMT